jgi:hypothetical protein
MNQLINVGAEVNRLHGEILEAARTSIDKAILIGELLIRQKAACNLTSHCSKGVLAVLSSS